MLQKRGKIFSIDQTQREEKKTSIVTSTKSNFFSLKIFKEKKLDFVLVPMGIE